MWHPFRSASLALPLLLATPVLAVDYYVSANGNDANNGTSQSTPWRTVARVNQSTYTYQPGDRILFERGGTYRGEVIVGISGNASAYLTIGAYGTGAKPIIKGSDLITGWTQHSGNIWKATVNPRVDQVYIGGQRMTPARFPNTGWLRNSQASGNTLYSTGLTQPNGYWNGARVVLRRTSSSVDTLVVTNYANGTLTFSQSISTMGTDDWGFFMTKKLVALDRAGEWFYDTATRTLYVWAPGNANPNSLQVEASVHNEGVNVYWQRHHIVIENIHFKHQRTAGVRVDVGYDVIVDGCTMEESFHGIRSVSTNCIYRNNTIRNTYATGALLIDNGTLFENNTLTRIATIIGEGEHAWGYFGVRSIGQNIVIRGNRLDTIGYTGLEVNGNVLVERNVIRHANATLNDGGGIAFDNADGLIIQDNIIMEPIGNTDGSSTLPLHDHRMGNGIYFGNTNIRNATVRRNTVQGCPGTGINVDHTKVSVNLKVIDNVLYDNNIQLTVSDYSNYNGPGATPPYHVPNFNDEYTGNIMYCTDKDQLTMKHFNCYSPNPVDFGTYSNNKFFNAFNESNILIHNFQDGGPKYYSLEKWREVKNEGIAGTKHPLRQNAQEVLAELSGNLVINGDFTHNVSGWGGWPTNAQATHVTNRLDNGALRAYLPNNSVYPTYGVRNPDWFPVINGEWYRMRLSLVSDAEGDIKAGLKGQSQLTNPYTVYERQVPFGPERRDLEFFFQSGMTDVAQIQLVNSWTDPLYYVDNVAVHRVSVQQVAPAERHVLVVNDQHSEQSLPIPAGVWSDVNGTQYSGTVSLAPFSSKPLYRVSTAVASYTVAPKVLLGGAVNWSDGIMRDNLRTANLIPAAEPYTGRGYALDNPGAVMAAGLLNVSGNQAIVDWVVVELRGSTDASYVVARKAALLRRDGTVVSPDGTTLTFPVPVVGHRLAIRHRNHLGVVTAQPLTTNGQVVDFSDQAFACHGGAAARHFDMGRAALWSGDVNGDGVLRYTGAYNDRDAMFLGLGSVQATATVPGYLDGDTNLDGILRYSGMYNDRDQLLLNIGGVTPTAVREGQVP